METSTGGVSDVNADAPPERILALQMGILQKTQMILWRYFL
jgi:hypothetical protein